MVNEDAYRELARLRREYAELFHVDAELLDADDYCLRSGLFLQLARVSALEAEVGRQPASEMGAAIAVQRS